MGRGCGVGGEEEKWEEGERARMFCLAPWAPYSVLLGALGPPLKSNLNWKLSESVSNYRLDLTGAFSDPCLYKYTHHPICTRTVQTTGQSVEWAHCLNRSPSVSSSCWTLLGNALQSFSTCSVALTSAQQVRRRLPNSSLLSFQQAPGRLCSRRARSQDTAVSCSMSSCRWPGCTLASSPQNALKPHVRRASLNSGVILPEPGW